MFGTFISSRLLPAEFGFLSDISVEVLIQDCLICSILCCVPLFFSDYHHSGGVKCVGQWVIHDVLFSHYAVLNEFAGSCSVIKPLLLPCWNVNEGQESDHMVILQ